MTKFLLLKRGLYYRPDSAGYTGVKDYAGRYSEAEANSHGYGENGVSFMVEADAPEYSPNCYDDEKLRHVSEKLEAANDKIHDLEAINSTLEITAAGWKQEARTQTSTVHEIYQAVTGGTGEPGDWHGAVPVVAELERLRGSLKQANRDLDAALLHGFPECHAFVRYRSNKLGRPCDDGSYFSVKIVSEFGSVNVGLDKQCLEQMAESARILSTEGGRVDAPTKGQADG